MPAEGPREKSQQQRPITALSRLYSLSTVELSSFDMQSGAIAHALPAGGV